MKTLTLLIGMISCAAFAQAVKPCKCPDAGSGSCSDAGVYGIKTESGATLTRNWIDTTFRPCFETGIAATYVFKSKTNVADFSVLKSFGDVYLNSGTGGWNLYVTETQTLQFVNWSPSSGSPAVIAAAGYDGGIHTVCVHKSSADVYKMSVDGVQVGTVTSSQSGCNGEWRTYIQGDPRPFKGTVYQAAFFYENELTLAQCGAVQDGGTSVSAWRADAGMEFGYVFNRTGEDLASVNPSPVILNGKLQFEVYP